MRARLIIVLSLFLITNVSATPYEITVQGLAGEDIKLSSYKGDVFLLDLMATWCQPCAIQTRDFVQNYKELKDTLTLVSISVSPASDTPSKVNKTKYESGATWTFAIDTYLQVFDEYNPSILPTLLLFDVAGNLIERWEGITNSSTILDRLNSTKDRVTFPLASFLIFITPMWAVRRSYP